MHDNQKSSSSRHPAADQGPSKKESSSVKPGIVNMQPEAIAARQLLPLTGKNAVQRRPAKVVVPGISHLVRLNGNTLLNEDAGFLDNEEDEVNNGSDIWIETADTFLSRRGPNQEVAENRAADSRSEPQYLWYRVISLNGDDSFADREVYIREDAFVAAPLEGIDEADGENDLDEEARHPAFAIAARVTQSSGQDCDRWAQEFQAALAAERIPFTPKMIMIRKGRKIGGMAAGARINFNGRKIGDDTHFFTVVDCGGQRFVFDNINPLGIPEAAHTAALSFRLNVFEEGDAGIDASGDLIRRDLPAAAARSGDHINTVVRNFDKKKA